MNAHPTDSPPVSSASGAKSPIPAQWVWHYRALRRIREHLLREHEEHSRAIREPFERRAADAIDVANDESDHETLLAEIKLEEAELAEVEAALRRVREGTYGICEVTGELIAAARLRAVPWTRYSQAGAKLVTDRLQR